MGHTALGALKGNSYRRLGSIPTCKETSMDLPPALSHCPPHPITDESPLARTVTAPRASVLDCLTGASAPGRRTRQTQRRHRCSESVGRGRPLGGSPQGTRVRVGMEIGLSRGKGG